MIYLLTFFVMGSSFLTPRIYALLHRKHHAYSDTEKDPHSPHFFNDIFRMMLHTKKVYADIAYDREKPEPHLDGNFPVWNTIDRIGDSLPGRFAFALAYVVFYLFFATHWWMFLLLPVHFLMGSIHGAIVNWCGHKYGYVNFNNGDRSKNTEPWGVVMVGELLQNNHHKFPRSPKFSKRWFEFDPTYCGILLMSWLRIIRVA